MTVVIDIRDRNGHPVELGQVVALKVYRRSGSYSNWWKRCNVNHFRNFWIPGKFELQVGHNEMKIVFCPDRESEKALAQPMGREREEQNVDYVNVPYYKPENLDTLVVPAPGTFREEA